jgi:chromate transporter
MNAPFTSADWVALLGHFMVLSLLSVGGAITTAPEMQRYLVDEQQWLRDDQFTASIALSQAAPGPNILFVALLGWYVGVNAAGGLAAGAAAWPLGFMGALVAMLGMLVPSTTLTFLAARWSYRNKEMLAVRAFKAGMAPIVIGLLGSTGWILSAKLGGAEQSWRLWLLTATVTLVVWRTRTHMLWLLAAGALLGALGWV